MTSRGVVAVVAREGHKIDTKGDQVANYLTACNWRHMGGYI